jgi:hypothetical protein
MPISIRLPASHSRFGTHSLEQVFTPVEMAMLLPRSLGTRLCTLTLALSACILPSACVGHSPDSCPSYLVRLDASALAPDGGAAVDGGLDGGVVGFTFVGEYGSGPICPRYCPSDYPVCQLVSETTVKCQKGCA